MTNQSEEKKKKKFNIIDILIVAVILAAVLFAVYFFYSQKHSLNATGTKIPIKYTITLEIVNSDYHNAVKAGDVFTDSVRSSKLGKVVDVVYSPATFTAMNQQTGDLEIYDYPDHEEIKIVVLANAVMVKNQYNIDGYDIAVGTKVSFQTPGFQGNGFCTNLEVVQEKDAKKLPATAKG